MIKFYRNFDDDIPYEECSIYKWSSPDNFAFAINNFLNTYEDGKVIIDMRPVLQPCTIIKVKS